MERLTERSCADFTAALAAHTPVPGGGGAAALCGALGAALCAMAGRYTVGKKKYAAVEDRVRELADRADGLRARLLDLAEADAAAFQTVSRAWSLPRDAPERAEAVEAAAREASGPPLDMVRTCGEALELLREMAEKGSVLLLSDVACGAVLCGAAMRCAALNVTVNTASMRDTACAAALDGETERLLHQWVPEADRIAEAACRRQRGE